MPKGGLRVVAWCGGMTLITAVHPEKPSKSGRWTPQLSSRSLPGKKSPQLSSRSLSKRKIMTVAPAAKHDAEHRGMSTGQCVVPPGMLVLSPTSPFMKKWDIFMMLLLVFTAIVTPIEVAFMETSLNALFVLNRLVDLSFIADIFLNFFLAFEDKESLQWVFSHRRIAKRYLRGWFLIDVASILPFDSLALADKLSTPTVVGNGTATVRNKDDLQKLKVMRVIRLLRLVKLARVVRAGRILQRVQSRLRTSFMMLSLSKYVIIVMVVIHWTACFWRLIPKIEYVEPLAGEADTNDLSGPSGLTWVHAAGMQNESEEYLYWSSFFFCLNQLVLGVPDNMGPQTLMETIFCCFNMMLAGTIWVYIVGAVCGIVSTMNPATTTYHQMLDDLNSYLSDIKFPKEKGVLIRT